MSNKKKKHSPQDHWEIKYSPNAASENMKKTQGANFNPVPAKTKPTTYVKVNECDH